MNYFGKINSFVQVGAHDGVMHDPLRKFILNNNWQGIFIEPQRDMLEKCKKNYQNIDKLQFVNIAVHPNESLITLYKVKNPKDYSHTGWASINSDRFNNTIYKDSILEEQISAKHLMKVIQENNFTSVDLLQIDTEGFDLEVIKMFDFNTFKPVSNNSINWLINNQAWTVRVGYSKNIIIKTMFLIIIPQVVLHAQLHNSIR
mgnify:CR=1 FL=1